MRRGLGYYLIVLGTAEIVLYFLRNSLPFIVRPHAGLLWSSVFVKSDLFSSVLSLAICIVLVGAGGALLTNRKVLIIVYCIIGGLIALVDLQLPVTILISGGGHALDASGAGLMLLIALFCDVIPVSLSIWQASHSARPTDLLPI